MKLSDLTLTDFLNELSSQSPAPGGGSVAALSGAEAASLVLMVGALTTNKKKFKVLAEKTQNDYVNMLNIFEQSKKELIDLIDEDTNAFNQVMAAYKMPKETEHEKNIRDKSIELATIGCIKTPMKVATITLELLKQMDEVIKISNRNTVSDQGVAVLNLYTALVGALMNVKINLPGLSDEQLVKKYQHVMKDMEIEANALKDQLIEKIDYLLQ